MKQPINYAGSYHSNWAGYYFREALGYTSGVHTGVDYNGAGGGDSDLGMPIVAIAGGKVVARISNGEVSGFGNALIIQTDGCPPGVNGSKLYHRYLHMNSVNVNVGQAVNEGQQIGTVGNTGTQYAHLHLDLWTDRNGLGAHWNYDKNTALTSYEDAYRVIQNNPNWNGITNNGGNTMAETISDDVARQIGWHYLGRNGFDGKPNALQSPQGDLQGKPLTNAQLSTFFLSAEARDWRDSRIHKVYAERDGLKSQNSNLVAERDRLAVANAELTKTVSRLNGEVIGLAQTVKEKQAEINTLQDQVVDLEKENKELKAQLATCGGDDTELLNSFGEILRKLIERIGLKK